MKKNIFGAAIIAAMVAVSLTACDKSQQETEAVAPAAKAGEMKIAYVDMDSVGTQYQFCKDVQAKLTKKGQSVESTLQRKQQELQSAAANFQQKVQSNALTQQQAQQIQAGLQKQSADLQALQQRLGSELQEEEINSKKEIYEEIQKFLAEYNKDKKYSMILIKEGVLYGDPALDITKEVVAGLNKSYKPKAEKKEEKKETEKK